MDLEPKLDGRMHFTLGPVEKWIIAAAASSLVAAGYAFANSLNTRLDRQSSALQSVVTQQAVTNGQISTLSAQLADVPSLTRQLAELRVQVQRNTEDVRDYRRTTTTR